MCCGPRFLLLFSSSFLSALAVMRCAVRVHCGIESAELCGSLMFRLPHTICASVHAKLLTRRFKVRTLSDIDMGCCTHAHTGLRTYVCT